MLEYIVLVAAFASLLGALGYIRSMFRGQTIPNRVTWFMWSIAPFIATAASFSVGVTWAVLPVLMSGVSPFMIFMASFFTKKATWKISSFDYLCGAFSALAIVFWYVTHDPNLAIIFAILSDTLAAIPTLTKAWRNPQTESVWPFLIGIFGPITSFIVATSSAFSEIAFPAYLILINLLLLLATSKKFIQKKEISKHSIGMAGPLGFEPRTSGSAGQCHNPY